MKRNPSVEHLENAVILAYLDGELPRAAARTAKHHLHSCWKCRSAATELETLAQTANEMLSSGDQADRDQTDTAKAEFLRRKSKIDETWDKSLRKSRSISERWTLAQLTASRCNYFVRFCFAHLRLCAAAIFARASALRVRLFFAVRGRRDAVEV